jgi:hypothetical protein
MFASKYDFPMILIYPKYSEKNVFCTQSQTEKYCIRYEIIYKYLFKIQTNQNIEYRIIRYEFNVPKYLYIL